MHPTERNHLNENVIHSWKHIFMGWNTKWITAYYWVSPNDTDDPYIFRPGMVYQTYEFLHLRVMAYTKSCIFSLSWKTPWLERRQKLFFLFSLSSLSSLSSALSPLFYLFSLFCIFISLSLTLSISISLSPSLSPSLSIYDMLSRNTKHPFSLVVR